MASGNQQMVDVREDQKERVPKAAARYGLSVWTLWAWLSAGKIRRWKMGGATLVSLRELEEFMERSTTEAESEKAGNRRRKLAAQRRHDPACIR
jgi:excisionase family DNA binding protein